MISRGSVVKDVDVRYGCPWFELQKFFLTFLCIFLPHGDCSIRASQPCEYMLVWFSLYNFVSVTLLLFKLSKATAMMISLFTSYSPVVMTKVVFFLHE